MSRKARKLDVGCPNATCKCYKQIGLRNVIQFGYQKNGTKRYKCTECKRTFARTINTPFFHMHFLKKGHTIRQVAEMRALKEGTVWEHAVKGIASNHLSIFVVLPKKRVFDIFFHIHSATDTLTVIKQRIADQTITFNEIACVLVYFKTKQKYQLPSTKRISGSSKSSISSFINRAA